MPLNLFTQPRFRASDHERRIRERHAADEFDSSNWGLALATLLVESVFVRFALREALAQFTHEFSAGSPASDESEAFPVSA